ncbi:cytidylyltransferase domain-containing protein [Pseudoalteromonas aurantia]|nr:acylneuraminate cytidylyltransferase family protein [Pseudoalteromonas aurantia]
MSKLFVVTFARGGSKGLSNKNIKLLNGKPLLTYSLNVAKELANVEAVFVSTDSGEIAKVAKQYNAQVIERPSDLATDTANEWDAWQHSVMYLKQNYNMQDDDLFLSLPCTSPLRTKEDIEKLVSEFECSQADLALCVSESTRNPFFNMVTLNSDKYAQVVCDVGQFHRRQDVPPVFDITTVGYVTTAQFVLAADSVLSGSTLGVEIPKSHSVDIDDQCDFDFAEVLIKRRG